MAASFFAREIKVCLFGPVRIGDDAAVHRCDSEAKRKVVELTRPAPQKHDGMAERKVRVGVTLNP
jgi:hypothetical protein